MRKYVKRIDDFDELEEYTIARIDYRLYKKVYIERDYKRNCWKVTMFYKDEKENENDKENQ